MREDAESTIARKQEQDNGAQLTRAWIGDVGREIVKSEMRDQPDGACQTFALEQFDNDDLFAILRALLDDPELRADIDFVIPDRFRGEAPDLEVRWFPGDAGSVRNEQAAEGKRAILTVIGDDKTPADTLRLVGKINKDSFFESGAEDLWLLRFMKGDSSEPQQQISVEEESRLCLKAAISGFIKSGPSSLDLAATYLRKVRADMVNGDTFTKAFGVALPTLNLPRDEDFFSALKKPTASGWEQAFRKLYRERGEIIRGSYAGQFLESDVLRGKLESMKDFFEKRPELLAPFSAAAENPSGPAIRELLFLDWEQDGVGVFLTTKPKKERKKLSEATREVLKRNLPSSTKEELRRKDEYEEYLDELGKREDSSKKLAPTAADDAFYQKIWPYVRDDASLTTRWDKFLNPREIECTDFAAGLLHAVNSLFSPDTPNDGGIGRSRRIRIAFQAKQPSAYTGKLSPSMMQYFNIVYRDIRGLLGDSAVWWTNFGKADAPDPLLDWNGWVSAVSLDVAKAKRSEGSWQLKFVISEIDEKEDPIPERKVVLTWKFADGSLPCRLHDFMSKLLPESGTSGRSKRSPRKVEQIVQLTTRPANDIGKTGVFREVTLEDIDGLSKGNPDIVDIHKIISEAIQKRPGELTADFCDAYKAFADVYRSSVQELVTKGFDFTNASAVLDAYERLLRRAAELPESERNRTSVIGPLLSVGMLRALVGSTTLEIIPPWHPMRMFEIARQHLEVASAVRHILAGNRNLRIGREFPVMLADEAESPKMPPMAASLDDSLCSGGIEVFPKEHCHWFTLCAGMKNDSMSPVRSDSASANRAVTELSEALASYKQVEDMPGADAKLLVIEASSANPDPMLRRQLKGELNEGRNIELTLQNEERDVAARIFNSLSGMMSNDAEASPTPLAQFRTAVSRESLKTLLVSGRLDGNDRVRPYHLALIDMIGTKRADFKWTPVSWAQVRDAKRAKPGMVDCRKFEFSEETLSQVLLVNPEFTGCDEIFLRHVFRVCRKTKASEAYVGNIHLPVKEIRTDQSSTNKLGQMLLTAHELADWVVTCDNMLTKRQISHGQKLIIRCKRATATSHSAIISSSSSADSLQDMLRIRLRQLGATGIRPDAYTVCQRLNEEALTVSGYVGLRAAKRMEPAGELIGLCLSKTIVSDMFAEECRRLNEDPHFLAFLMLDDYASWFGGKESGDQSIADIIALGYARRPSGEGVLHLIITESKYCKSLDEQKRSRAQLARTLAALAGSLVAKDGGPEESLSVRVWLNRFAEMILDADLTGLKVDTETFYQDLNEIRSCEVEITLNGYSHYFAFDELGSAELRQYPDGNLTYHQQVFGREEILTLLENLTVRQSTARTVYAYGSEAEAAYRFQPITLMKPADIIDSKECPSRTSCEAERPAATSREALTERNLDWNEGVSDSPAQADRPTSVVADHTGTVPAREYGPRTTAIIERNAKPVLYSKERLAWCDRQAAQLRFGLNDNNISVKEIKHIPTPNGCLVVLEGNRNLGVNLINSLKEQLLMTRRIRIGFSEAASGEFRVFVESPERETVSMWNMWKERKARRNKDGTNTSLAIALKEADGTILYLDPMSSENDPHTLIAGSTGSGKSVLVQTLLADIAATNPPELSKIYIIDTKNGVDYAPFRKLPHLAAPVIDDLGEAVRVFDQIVAEMNRRYELFAQSESENLKDYNCTHQDSKLPIIWVFHDELAEAMSDKDYCKEVTPRLKMLATKARAAGIFLFFIAQRPDKDAVPMQVRDNLGNRLALKLKTEASSKIALDRTGAECLLGKGHLAARIGNDVIYAQCPFLGKEELKEVVAAIIQDCDSRA